MLSIPEREFLRNRNLTPTRAVHLANKLMLEAEQIMAWYENIRLMGFQRCTIFENIVSYLGSAEKGEDKKLAAELSLDHEGFSPERREIGKL